MVVFLIFAVLIVSVAPLLFNNVKVLFAWICFVYVLCSYISIGIFLGFGSDAPAGAGGILIITGFVLILNTIVCSFKGYKSFKSSGGTLGQLTSNFAVVLMGAILVLIITVSILMTIGLAIF